MQSNNSLLLNDKDRQYHCPKCRTTLLQTLQSSSCPKCGSVVERVNNKFDASSLSFKERDNYSSIQIDLDDCMFSTTDNQRVTTISYIIANQIRANASINMMSEGILKQLQSDAVEIAQLIVQLSQDKPLLLPKQNSVIATVSLMLAFRVSRNLKGVLQHTILEAAEESDKAFMVKVSSLKNRLLQFPEISQFLASKNMSSGKTYWRDTCIRLCNMLGVSPSRATYILELFDETTYNVILNGRQHKYYLAACLHHVLVCKCKSCKLPLNKIDKEMADEKTIKDEIMRMIDVTEKQLSTLEEKVAEYHKCEREKNEEEKEVKGSSHKKHKVSHSNHRVGSNELYDLTLAEHLKSPQKPLRRSQRQMTDAGYTKPSYSEV